MNSKALKLVHLPTYNLTKPKPKHNKLISQTNVHQKMQSPNVIFKIELSDSYNCETSSINCLPRQLSNGGVVNTGAVCYEQAKCLIKCINEQILGKSAVLQHGRHQQQGMILKGLQVSRIREYQWTRLRAKHQGSRLIVE